MGILGTVFSIGAFRFIIHLGFHLRSEHCELSKTPSSWSTKGNTSAKCTENRATPLGKVIHIVVEFSSSEVVPGLPNVDTMAGSRPPRSMCSVHPPAHSFAHQCARVCWERIGIWVTANSPFQEVGSPHPLVLDPASET